MPAWKKGSLSVLDHGDGFTIQRGTMRAFVPDKYVEELGKELVKLAARRRAIVNPPKLRKRHGTAGS